MVPKAPKASPTKPFIMTRVLQKMSAMHAMLSKEGRQKLARARRIGEIQRRGKKSP